jgi:hypothetical protein
MAYSFVRTAQMCDSVAVTQLGQIVAKTQN